MSFIKLIPLRTPDNQDIVGRAVRAPMSDRDQPIRLFVALLVGLGIYGQDENLRDLAWRMHRQIQEEIPGLVEPGWDSTLGAPEFPTKICLQWFANRYKVVIRLTSFKQFTASRYEVVPNISDGQPQVDQFTPSAEFSPVPISQGNGKMMTIHLTRLGREGKVRLITIIPATPRPNIYLWKDTYNRIKCKDDLIKGVIELREKQEVEAEEIEFQEKDYRGAKRSHVTYSQIINTPRDVLESKINCLKKHKISHE
jgi:hypothetical protein